MSYIQHTGYVTRISDGVRIPLSIPGAPGQTEYYEWLALGNVPSPEIPQVVTRFQGRAALHNAGLLPTVEAMMSQSDAVTQLAWKDALVFERNSPLVIAMAAALSLSESQLDELFVTANTITI